MTDLTREEEKTTGWIGVDERLPKPGEFVLAYFKNEYGKDRRVRAMWADKTTLPLGDGQDMWPECYVDEDTCEVYCEPGWYETNDGEETHWRINDNVTHWMPLPCAPDMKREQS